MFATPDGDEAAAAAPGAVQVCDFGLSQVRNRTYLSTRNELGTAEWMAPGAQTHNSTIAPPLYNQP